MYKRSSQVKINSRLCFCGQVNLNINVNIINTAENVFTGAELVFMSETKEKKFWRKLFIKSKDFQVPMSLFLIHIWNVVNIT